MPAYTTITVEFDKRSRSHLVHAFYTTFVREDIAFDRVFAWGCDPDLSFDQIVSWNQDKLDADFRLAHSQNVSHDYRQILVTVQPFSECRIFLMNFDTSIEFHCIVPEEEIGPNNCGPLLDACLRTWYQLPVLAIESYGEIDSNAGYAAIKSGKRPSARLFAIVDRPCEEFEHLHGFQLRQLSRGYLITRRYA